MTDIAVVDGNVLFAELLCGALSEYSFHAVGLASTAEAAVDLVRERRPPLCLVDPRSLPDENDDVVVRLVAAGAGGTHVVVVTDDVDEAAVRAARAVGASLLPKGGGMVMLLDALGRVERGETVVRLPRRIAVRRSEAATAVHRLAATLTVRERECLAMLVDGATTAQMVEELGISVMTVRSHVRSVLCKLGVHSRLEAASLAVRHGLVETVQSDVG